MPAPDEKAIEALVAAFYGRVREDDVLGPVFASAVADWPAHLARMVDFWMTVACGAKRFKGNVSARHQAMPNLTPAMFGRWLALFGDCARATCEPAAAHELERIALRVATGLAIGLFGRASAAALRAGAEVQ